MIQHDYIMRMIEMFTRFLARILHLKEAKQYAQALAEIQEAVRKISGLDLKSIDILFTAKLLETERYIMIANLLKEQGDIYELQNKTDQSYNSYLKALNFLLESVTEIENIKCEHYVEMIDYLINKLKNYQLSAYMKYKIFKHYEIAGRYSKAKDLLFELLSENDIDAAIIENGILFYKKLMQKTDNELNKLDLARQELEDGLQILERKRIHFK